MISDSERRRRIERLSNVKHWTLGRRIELAMMLQLNAISRECAVEMAGEEIVAEIENNADTMKRTPRRGFD